MNLDYLNENIQKVKNEIANTCLKVNRNPAEVTLIAVSKKFSVAYIQQAFNCGLNNFGENYWQEAKEKINYFKANSQIIWHYIGKLQTNKVKEVVRHFEYIHSLDNLPLAEKINKEAARINKLQKVLIQINWTQKQGRAGINLSETMDFINNLKYFKNLNLAGLMCLAPFFTEAENTRIYFKQMKILFEEIRQKNLVKESFKYLSMGMSNDFTVALEEGANMLRIGTLIFGKRMEK